MKQASFETSAILLFKVFQKYPLKNPALFQSPILTRNIKSEQRSRMNRKYSVNPGGRGEEDAGKK